MRSTLSSSGAAKPLPNGRALGAMVGHPPSAHGNAALSGPGAINAGFSPGVGELNAGDRALPFDEARDPLQRFEVFVAPDAKILRGDPPFGRDRRRFGENQAGAADRARGQMGEMPIIGKTVFARVLAHRRNADAIGKRDAAQSELAEQMRH